MHSTNAASPLLALLPLGLATGALLPLLGCELGDSFGTCGEFSRDYQDEIRKSGELLTSVPATAESFAMGLLLNQNAVNYLFQQLADTSLPQLTQSVTVLGQTLNLAVEPRIPLFQIGGDRVCPDCITADVPFTMGVGINRNQPSMGTGTISVQMPLGMVAESDRKTTLVAGFRNLGVRSLTIDTGLDVADFAVDAAEPVITTLLTGWLRSRFDSAPVASFDSWELGRGEVLLAGRGPFVDHDAGTILVAMQSNLKLNDGTTVDADPRLPAGADIGIVFHPELLLSMTRRMNYEGVIPAHYEADGTASARTPLNAAGTPSGGVSMTLTTMASTNDQLLRVGSRLWSTKGLCGSADVLASMGLELEPGRFAFAIRDVQVTETAGIGQIFTQTDTLTNGLLTSVVDTLDLTVNYDKIFGGESETQSRMGPVRATIDSRGISVFLNVLDLPGE